MIRKLLRSVVDRALVGPRPVVRPVAEPEGKWTEAAPVPEEPVDDLEVEVPVSGSLLLDVREPGEYAGGVATEALLIPMDLVPHQLLRLPRDRAITVYCAAGVRSYGVAHWLREQGFDAYSLAPGVGYFREAGVPPGVRPGTRLKLPAGECDGAWAPAAEGEVIQQEGDQLRVRVSDEQGFWVERRVGAGR
ncbi:MAG: hypothetical protein FJ090_09785 [Deltaproteobacteria bacterium]|nr:hypothetical protein [Deltaproteobacteria bacterium]